jgi:polyketide synthase PksN
MEERLGVIVGSIKELEEKLNGFVKGQYEIEDLYRGQVKRNKETLALFIADEELQEAIEKWIHRKKYAKILEIWVKGLSFEWNKLYSNIKPHRISLPTYPFARERFWVPKIEFKSSGSTLEPIKAFLHPLLHENTSDFSEQRFSSTFTGQEFFLADHIVKGQRVLPGVAYLEMARAAVVRAIGAASEGKTKIRLKNIVWVRPAAIEKQPVEIHIGLFPKDNGEIDYEIYSELENDKVESIVHNQGLATLGWISEVPTLDLLAIQDQCRESTLSSKQCYELFKAMGIDYGLGHQGVGEIYIGSGQLLAKLSLPSSVANTQGQFVLHPSLMDSALQSTIGLMVGTGNHKLALPFALQELEIIDDCTSDMWAFVQYSDGSKTEDKVQTLDIDLCDETGRICVRMKGFASRILDEKLKLEVSPKCETLMFHPIWKEQAIVRGGITPEYAQHLVVFCGLGEIPEKIIESQLNGVRCITLEFEQEGIEDRFQTYAAQLFEEIKKNLQKKPKGKVLIQVVVSTLNEQRLFSGLSGLLKTAHLENPKIIGQLIEVEQRMKLEGIIEILQENKQEPVEDQIRYQEGRRLVSSWNEIGSFQEKVRIPWKEQGVYLITGGAGGLGMIFAQEIVQRVKNATLILTGRSSLNPKREDQLKELGALGAQIEYRQVDVTDKNAITGLIQSINEEFGSLHGIIHGAGIARDNFIIRKTKEELQEVLAPKVSGLVNLDQASKGLSLDFFILFSSISGSLGNVGQADYAAGNAFMDAYAKYRNFLVASNQRQGQTLSINWPLWKDGGMHVDEEIENKMMRNTGMTTLETSIGIQALYQALASGKDQIMVLEGDVLQLRRKLSKYSDVNNAKYSNGKDPIIIDGITDLTDDFYQCLLDEIAKGELSEEKFESLIIM